MIAETLLVEPVAPVSNQKPTIENNCGDHHERLLAITDAMDILQGRWKIQLIGLLLFKGKMRFGELHKHVRGIGAKMLSKELQNLEANKIVTRTVLQTKPITVEYEITRYGKSLEKTITSIVDFGKNHRKQIMGSPEPEENHFIKR